MKKKKVESMEHGAWSMGHTAFLITIPVLLLCISCDRSKSKEEFRNEILQAEQDFARMAKEKGIAEAFYYFADENAVIKRENDTLISGKDNIKNYFMSRNNKAIPDWTPDFIDVSDCGDFGYTYGKYTWKVLSENGDTTEFKGVFHTVWKRQADNSWKYVWD